MSKNTTTLGTVVTFTAEDSNIVLRPSKVSRDECRLIGWGYYTAIADGDTKTQTAMLNTHGAILMRRSLLVFANYASRTNQPAVAKFAKGLRDEITAVRKAVA